MASVAAGDVEIDYTDTGSGPVLVFVHGALSMPCTHPRDSAPPWQCETQSSFATNWSWSSAVSTTWSVLCRALWPFEDD